MSNFIFNAATAALTAAILDLGTGNYYAHLVTTAPLLTDSTVANLVVPTVSGYAPTTLTGLSDNSQRWTFDSFVFPRYIFAANPPVGVVICKRAGASPAAGDQVICYSDFLNSINQVIFVPVGAYLISLAFGSDGAINKTYRYLYTSGSYVSGANGGFPNGLIYLLGTNNNTSAFTNPAPSKINIIDVGNGSNYINTLTDRSTASAASHYSVGFDFGANKIKVGDFGIYLTNDTMYDPAAIYGSNTLTNWSSASVSSNTNWTQLATVSPSIANSIKPGWMLLNCTNISYWRYLKIQSTVLNSSVTFYDIELYNSSIISPNQNLI